jgi:adenylate cyclase
MTASRPQMAAFQPSTSIAVLPFAHLSSDPDDEYFCDGLAEELINALARIEKLKVVARTSAFSFKGKNIEISQIGNILNVKTILEGSVRKSGDRLRITVQLIDAADGYHIWSRRYDREMRDVFELQDEITLAIVDALKSKLLGDEKAELRHRFTANTEAFHLYLQGRFYVNKFTTGDAYKAVECFTEAIAIAPDFALAYAGLADSYIMLTEMGPMGPIEAMPKAKDAALKALSFDADLAEAHASLGMILQDYDYDFAAAEAEFQRAIELSPNNPIPRQSYGILLTELERHDEAETQFKKMLEVDPLSVVGNWIHSFCLFLARRFDDALERAKLTLELDPSFGVAYLSVAFAYQMKGEYAASVDAYCKCSEVMGFPQNAAFIRESFTGGWEEFLRSMTSSARPMTFSSYIIAVFFATLGDKDGAFAELEASFAKRESHIVMMKSDPRFDSLRGDPRFPDLLYRIGFD